MDHGACNIVYLDRRAQDEIVRRDTLGSSLVVAATNHLGSTGNQQQLPAGSQQSYFEATRSNTSEVRTNVETILSWFNTVHICSSGASCLAKLSDLQVSDSATTPTVVLIDVPYDEEQRLKRQSREPRTPSPTFRRRPTSDLPEPNDIYGMNLLRHVSSEIQQRSMSRLVIPVVILSGVDGSGMISPALPNPGAPVPSSVDGIRLVQYLDAGAVDVFSSPIPTDSARGLMVHAYRVYREVSRENSGFLSERKSRKLSWVGVDEIKPYAYLREAMVSGLMSGICNPETFGESLDPNEIEVSPERREKVARAVGCWSFSAHEFSDDELLLGALMMLEHALAMPELQRFNRTTDELMIFLLASRKAYNHFVLYHNFRHVADVLQAMFYFLVQIGTLPPFELGDPPSAQPPSAIASLLKPFDALTLLIAAIGHDVGHPGVNNAFLVALNSPLAQLYNDRSVLESFHCAAYSQILRRYWPAAFKDMNMRKLMINSILATDMGVHFKYMADLGSLQEKLAANNRTLDGWSAKSQEEYKDLACGLLIKCADICNVARKFRVAAQWAHILTDEFCNQGNMEKELDIPTCLFGGPPDREDMIKMGESQIGFANIFARPLFEAVTDVIPAMSFSVAEILENKKIWESKIEEEKQRRAKASGSGFLSVQHDVDGARSPMSRSYEDIKAEADDSAKQANGRNTPDSRHDSGSDQTANPSEMDSTTNTATTEKPSQNQIPPASLESVSSSSRPSSSSINSPAPFTQSDITSRRSSSGATSFPVSRPCREDSGRPDSADMGFVHRGSIATTGNSSVIPASAPARPSDISSAPRPSTADTTSLNDFAKGRFSFQNNNPNLNLTLTNPNGYVTTSRGATSEVVLPRSPDSAVSPGTNGIPPLPGPGVSPSASHSTSGTDTTITSGSDRRRVTGSKLFTRSRDGRIRHARSSDALNDKARFDGVNGTGERKEFLTALPEDSNLGDMQGDTEGKRYGIRFWKRRWKEMREQEGRKVER